MNNNTTTTKPSAPADKSAQITIMDSTECFAVPGDDSIIDCINPITDRSWINCETLEQIRERYPLAQRISLDYHCKEKAIRQNTPLQWTEVSRERYWEMMEVLPPAAYLPVAETGYFPNITQGFLVGEPWDHCAATGAPRFAAFIKRGHTGIQDSDAKFYEANRPMTRKEFIRLAD